MMSYADFVPFDPETDHEDGVWFGLDEDAYHADRALGSSDVKNLLIGPETYWAGSWMNPMREVKETVFTLKGSAYHCLILEGEEAYKRRYAIALDREDYPDALVTSEEIKAELRAQGQKVTGNKPELVERLLSVAPDMEIWDHLVDQHTEEHELAGRDIIPPKMDREITYQAAFILRNPAIAGAFEGGFPEVSVFWTRPDGIRCKARFDYTKPGVVTDLKTFSNPYNRRPEVAAERSAAQNSHDVQAAWYLPQIEKMQAFLAEGRVFGGVTPSPDWREAFCAAENVPLYFVYQQTGGVPVARAFDFHPRCETLKAAYSDCTVALHTYRACLEEFGTEAAWIRPAPPQNFSDEAFAFIRR